MVRKILLSVYLFGMFMMAQAQEAAAEAPESGDYFSEQIKFYMVAFIFALSIFFTVRTFRNKPEA
ncbi:MAG: hypothetical protein RIC30_21315 [Marinoscillum sp.]|uniref:hypothetical protein n=1 Tax=Marinoscillum sp. TaxID=2024838 RepID=UPI0032F55E6C